ncbi:amino acid ABC transporter substrate-binding protein [Sinomicrobium weinanense]|uniref:LysM peptidoglycan-binding domain-containing protein n=1 Tax=Sinomicrobium weinanense TaxID=2842200 RepID=A0A926JQ68_9FLAO|nr:LysM peptidoglycan-binding domain-containing protein [Sinomicrobium weinanense]MBC9795288.1 LysM peptidoglycan-binding domain-containing protein [Sinomicrobium weinanense]MBU3125760.1 LysM peptidoglycan-binding domain-containing protein [Sinomicrobium weinanense]
MTRFIILSLVLLFGFFAHAQEFDTHAVKRGETIQSIAREYQVNPSDIIRLNPEVKNGLPVNTILIIPVSEKAKKEGAEIAQDVVSFITHKVRRKETLYSIANLYGVGVGDIKRYNKELYSRPLKKREKIRVPRYEHKTVEVFKEDEGAEHTKTYIVEAKEGKWRVAYKHGITIEELEELNPDMGDVLKPGQELQVPDHPEKTEKPIDDSHNYYVVQPKEGFYRLKVKLGVTREELEGLNPELKENGLKAGMVLKLPKSLSGSLEIEDGIVTERFNLMDSIDRRSVSDIALVLPFKLNELGTESDYKKKIRDSKLLSRSLDFYTGALAALDSAKQMGLSVNVRVLDSRASIVGTGRLLTANDFRDMDAVIGPFLSKPFNEVAGGVRGIPAFLPFSGKVRPLNNIFQTVPDDNVLREKMINYIRANAVDRQIIVIADSQNAGVRDQLTGEIENVRVLNPTGDKFIRLNELKGLLSAEKENWVIVETNDIVMLTNVTGVLNSARSEQHRITMFTTKKGNAYDSESVSNFHLANLNLHYPTVDKASSENSPFVKAYEKKYGITPNRYAARGYDLMLDVVLRLAYDKDLFKTASRIGETKYLENKFKYHKTSQGGYYNNGTYIVKYNNKLEIEEVK